MKKYLNFKNISKLVRILLIVILVGVLIIGVLFSNEGILNNLLEFILHSAIYGSALWYGNSFLSNRLKKIFPWNKNPLKILIISVSSTIIYSAAIVVLLHFLISVIVYDSTFETYKVPVQFVLVLLMITFIISITLHSISFFKEWKNAVIREAELKRSVLELEYESLKSQVNPHFLFNSLNALTSLVGNNDDAVYFIKNLSDVYRYLLEQKDKETVSLSTEIKFVESYIYLHKIRFGDNLNTNININDNKFMLVPFSLQMLIENAIKHNIVSEEEPLYINIYSSEDYLIVENNFQKKNIINNSTKIGLENIKKRYSYLTNKGLKIEKTNEKFTVKIPLLEMKDYNFKTPERKTSS